MQKDKLRQLIANGKTQQAFEELLKPELSSDKQWLPDLTTLSGKYSRLEREKRLGTISNEEYLRENAKIDSALSEMIEAYETPAAKGTEALPVTVAKADKQPCQLPAALKAYDLQPCTDPDPAHWVLHRNRGTYVMDEQCRLLGLNLSGLEVKDVSFFQSPDFQYLKALSLSETPLTTLRLPAQLTALQHLNIGDCANLKTLVFDGPLPALETLTADECALTALELPAGMTALRSLDLRKNQLTRLHFAGPSPSLSFLDASQNKLKELRFPGGFGALQYVYLNDNQLENLHFEAAPRLLEILHLRNNQLLDLPHNFLSFTGLKTLYLHENPLPNISKASLPQGERDNAFSSVRAFLSELREGKLINERAKIILVGNGRVGKTSMFNCLNNKDYDPNERYTHGITLGMLEKDKLPKVKTDALQANVWDFGGQEIFYATHQFFLTDEALYILCWTNDENTKAYRERDQHELPDDGPNKPREYWLETIRARGGPDCPIVLVQTHHEPDKKTEALNERDLLHDYKAICLNFSAKKKYHLAELKELIAKKLNEEVPFFGREVPSSYDRLIGFVEELAAKREKKISLDYFIQTLCREAKVLSGNEIEALHFLRKTGAVVWFHEDEELRETIFIHPDWLTKQVYRLINRKLEARNGKMDQDYLLEVFNDYTPEEREQFIVLLKKFKLIFETTEKDEETEEIKTIYIAPQYLPDELSADGKRMLRMIQNKLSQAFVFAFPKYMPDNVMVNFLSEYGPYSENLYWKKGICFQNQAGQDCIVRLLNDNSLEVMAPPGESSYALQAQVCHAFVELSRKANAEIIIDGLRVSWQDLVANRADGILKFRDKDNKPVEIALFDRFFTDRHLDIKGAEAFLKSGEVNITHIKKEVPVTETPHTAPATAPQKPKVFISYAHKDDSRYMKTFVQEIKKHCDWDIFDDRQILIGEDWHERLTREVAECDFGIMLLSPMFIQSEYIKKHEFGEFIQRNAKKGFPFFSVLLTHCRFTEWEGIAGRQIFVAHGQDYDLARDYRDTQISFAQLVRLDNEGAVIPNEYRNIFCMNFVEMVEKALKTRKS